MIFDFSKFLLEHTRSKDFTGNCDCRMASYFSQHGRCFVTGIELKPHHRELHHRLPRQYGGPDTPENTILLDKSVHRLIHATHPEEIQWLLERLKLTEPQLRHVQQLRKEARQTIVEISANQPTTMSAQ